MEVVTKTGQVLTGRRAELYTGACPPERPCTHEQVARYRAHYDGDHVPDAPTPTGSGRRFRVVPLPCIHLGEPTGERQLCPTCRGHVEVKLFACALHGTCTTEKEIEGVACCRACSDYCTTPAADVPPPSGGFALVAPLGTRDRAPAWGGRAAKKPWDYRVTAAIPHLDTVEPLRVAVELLRRQTERPYLLVIDTGSSPEVLAELEGMRADDLEVHHIRGHGWRHASEPVTAALDLAQTLCRTDYLFHTHADVFLRRRDFIEDWLGRCDERTPVVAYRLSERSWATDDWQWMTGHSLLLTWMPVIHKIGATWSYQRIHHQFGHPWFLTAGWPDTEVGWNSCLRRAGISPLFLGQDVNFQALVDENHVHVRSYPGSKLYGPEHHGRARKWMAEALAEARENIEKWDRKTEIERVLAKMRATGTTTGEAV